MRMSSLELIESLEILNKNVCKVLSTVSGLWVIINIAGKLVMLASLLS